MLKKCFLVSGLISVFITQNALPVFADSSNWVFGTPAVEYQPSNEDWYPKSQQNVQQTPAQTQQIQNFYPAQVQNQNLNIPVYNRSQGIKIPAGTAITITNRNEINADYVTKGQTIDFVVDNPVSVNGITVIKAGTSVTAEVLNKRNNFIFGIPGEISVGNFKLNNISTNSINMSGSISDKGSSRYWAHIGWLIVWPLLLVKGGDGIIPAGTRQTIYTIGDTYLNSGTTPINYPSQVY